MKKLITIICLLAAMQAFGQGYGTEQLLRDTLTIDGASGGTLDTMNIGVYLRDYEGYPYIDINLNAVKASSATDSFTCQWRRARGGAVADTFDAEPWTTFKVKNNTTPLIDYDWTDGAWVRAQIDFDGRPSPYIQIRSIFNGTSENDSLEMVIEYKDIRK